MVHSPFLLRLANLLLERHGTELDRVAVVLPGRRAGLYLRRYLAQAAGKTIWSPDMLDVGGFLQRLTGMRQADPLEGLFLLHEAHRAQFGGRAEDLSEFVQWAPVTLRDLSEVDSHLLDLDAFYRDLRGYHEIEEWSFRLGELSPGQERLLANWRATGDLHRLLHQRMRETGLGTSGFVARMAAGRAQDGRLELPWKAVWFAGLNALEPATTVVVKHLQQQRKAFLAWDSDRHYLDGAEQEAGTYLRRSIAALGPGELPPTDAIRTRPRRFVDIQVPNAVAQARQAASILADLSQEERADTAVVLANEDLLLPLLEALPSNIGPVNVTMGMTLRALPVHGLTEAFLDMHEQARDGTEFPLAAVERLLLHPFLHDGAATARTIAALRSGQHTWPSGRVVLDTARAQGLDLAPEVDAVFGDMADVLSDLPPRMLALIAWALNNRPGDVLVREQLHHVAQLQQRLHTLLARQPGGPLSLRTYATLRDRMLREEQLGFFGEPLRGLQIMGFLETRAIDHGTVILLGADEGVLPASSATQSWIPFDIRRLHRLPLAPDSAAITAYHFNRLLQQTHTVHLLHGGSDVAGAAEPSRYLAQWWHEVVDRTATTGERLVLTAPFLVRHAPAITVAKDPAVLARLHELAQRGLAPSALGTWLRCPLDFYFSQVLRVRPPDEADDQLAANELGNAVHAVLEELLRPTIGSRLHPDLLLNGARIAHDMLVSFLVGKYPASSLGQGHFKLRLEMAAHALAGYLKAEAERCRQETTDLVAVEEAIIAELRPGVRIGGRLDRIERRNGVLHVLDMKTGKVDPRKLNLGSFERDALHSDHRQALQLLMYAWSYLECHPEVSVLRAGIVPLQRVSQSDGLMLKVGGDHDITRAQLPAMAALLGQLVDELMDPALPFRHDPDSQWCSTCVG